MAKSIDIDRKDQGDRVLLDNGDLIILDDISAYMVVGYCLPNSNIPTPVGGLFKYCSLISLKTGNRLFDDPIPRSNTLTTIHACIKNSGMNFKWLHHVRSHEYLLKVSTESSQGCEE